jgi:hypothetical protein
VKVAVLFPDALVPFGLNVTEPGPLADQVYVRLPPSGSVAAALTSTVVPVTVDDEALAGEVTVGGEPLVTVTLAGPKSETLEAITVKGPPTVVAVNRPVPLIVPPPDTVHVNAALIAAPN